MKGLDKTCDNYSESTVFFKRRWLLKISHLNIGELVLAFTLIVSDQEIELFNIIPNQRY